MMKGEDFTSQTYLKDYKRVNGKADVLQAASISYDGKVLVENEVTGLEIKDKLDAEGVQEDGEVAACGEARKSAVGHALHAAASR